MLLIRVCVSQTYQLGPYTASETICGVKKRRMGLQKKDTEQQFPPKIKDGDVILNADIKVFKENEKQIKGCFLAGIGGVTNGNGSNKPKTLWNGNKKDKEEKKYRLDLQGYNNKVPRFAFQKETSVLAEVHLKEDTLPKDEVAKNGGAICELLYDAL